MNDHAIEYREADRGDAATIINFQLAMARETEGLDLDVEITSKGVYAVFDEPALGRYFIAENDDATVASLLITYEWSDWRNGMVWWIQSVYVVPPYRNRRVYAGLYAHIRNLIAEDESIRGIRLYVDERNKTAQEVYTRLGMNGEHYRVFEWMK
jgi:GNAT superfamily N-acetyltransferase